MSDRPEALEPARLALQQVATHVLARSRFAADGRFGLRVTVGGIGTPAFGPDGDVLRIAGGALIHEHPVSGGASSRVVAMPGRSLRDLATFAGVDLDVPFSAGEATPPIDDPDAPLAVDGEAATALLGWLALGTHAIDQVLAVATEPSVLQLWPEHFDVAVDVATAHGRVNLGASPGDAAHPAPYLYVGPWEAARPGDPDYWNAAFGALLARDAVVSTADPLAAAVAFFERGLELLG